jgi:CBS domain-containing protein
MQRDVVHASMDDTVATVEATLLARGLSWLPVVDAGGTVMGVIAAIDLLRFRAEGKDPSAVQAWQLCTYKPVTVLPQTPLRDVARVMVNKGVHHVVVADSSGLCGIVSSLDVVREFPAPA